MSASIGKSLAIGFFSLPFSGLALLIGRLAGGSWHVGFLSMLVTLGVFWLFAVINLFFIKELSWVDVFLPIPISVVWSIVLLPLSLGSNIFTAPACIGSAIIFTISMWMLKNKRMSTYWVIFPSMVFLYEMLPINIPGPFDDYFAFGGTAVLLLMQSFSNEVPEKNKQLSLEE